MPRYFFDLHDGVEIDDLHGLELPGIVQATDHAHKVAADLANSGAFAGGRKRGWELAVRDEHGDIVHKVSFSEFVSNQG